MQTNFKSKLYSLIKLIPSQREAFLNHKQTIFCQGIGIKGKEMALVWHEKASRTALQTSSVNFTHSLLVQTLNMTTVKEITEQCCQL